MTIPLCNIPPPPSSLIRQEVVLLSTCIIGDLVITSITPHQPSSSNSVTSTNRIFSLVLDNWIHALIAAIVWWIAISNESPRPPSSFFFSNDGSHNNNNLSALPSTRTNPLTQQGLEIIMAFVTGSMIDMDHFFSAKTFNFQGALNLSSRPFGHCTTIIIMLAMTTWFLMDHVVALVLPLWKGWGFRYGILLFSSGLSHHLRDALRRGLWFCPIGSTHAIPYPLYLLLLVSLPLLVRCSLTHLWPHRELALTSLPIYQRVSLDDTDRSAGVGRRRSLERPQIV